MVAKLIGKMCDRTLAGEACSSRKGNTADSGVESEVGAMSHKDIHGSSQKLRKA